MAKTIKVKKLHRYEANNTTYDIEPNSNDNWCKVYKNGAFKANAVSMEQARRVIWLDLVSDGVDIELSVLICLKKCSYE